jgi:hypothetical protein
MCASGGAGVFRAHHSLLQSLRKPAIPQNVKSKLKNKLISLLFCCLCSRHCCICFWPFDELIAITTLIWQLTKNHIPPLGPESVYMKPDTVRRLYISDWSSGCSPKILIFPEVGGQRCRNFAIVYKTNHHIILIPNIMIFSVSGCIFTLTLFGFDVFLTYSHSLFLNVN